MHATGAALRGAPPGHPGAGVRARRRMHRPVPGIDETRRRPAPTTGCCTWFSHCTPSAQPAHGSIGYAISRTKTGWTPRSATPVAITLWRSAPPASAPDSRRIRLNQHDPLRSVLHGCAADKDTTASPSPAKPNKTTPAHPTKMPAVVRRPCCRSGSRRGSRRAMRS